MRILHACDILQPVGGMQVYLRRLIELQIQAGNDVAVRHGDSGAIAPAGARCLESNDPGAIRTFIREFNPDVVHVHDWGLPDDIEAELSRERRLVRTLHDLSFGCSTGTRYFRNGDLCTRSHGPGCLVAAAVKGCAHRRDPRPVLASYRRVETLLPRVRDTPFTIFQSAYMRSLGMSNGIPSERCAAVPCFIEPPQGVTPVGDRPVVCFAGRVVPSKGFDLLLRSLARIEDAWERLIVAGDGWHSARCQRLAARLGIGEKLELRGWTDPEGVRAAIVESRVLAVPSRWAEPFGIVGLEAMALGRPVVATRAGGIPEWLDDGETGLMVPPNDSEAMADALSQLLTDQKFAQRLGEEGYRRVARFSPVAHLNALEDIYRDDARATRLSGQREVAA